MTFIWPIETRELTDQELTLLPWREARTIAGIVKDLVETCRDERTLRFTTVPEGYTEAMAEEFVQNSDVVRWALVAEGRYQGNIEVRLSGDEVNRTVNIGYAAAPWGRGRGLMTRALKLVLATAFEQDVYRVELKAARQNSASRHVAEGGRNAL